jgi:ATP phosphoribosyltransferase
MKNLENADIAIQKKGRLTEGTLKWLNENAGSDFPVIAEPFAFDRRRELTDSSTGITVVGYSNGDTVKAIACGQTDLGICGADMFNELPNDNMLRQMLGFGACRLVLARSEEAIGSSIEKIATSYPRLTDAYRRSRDNKLATADTVIDVYKGGVEMIGRRNDYDAVVDVVDTGETMAANGYCVTDTIANFEALLLETWDTTVDSIAQPDILEPSEFDNLMTTPIPLLAYYTMDLGFKEWIEIGWMNRG